MNTQSYPNLPAATWTCWGTNLVPFLASKGCDAIELTGGGTASGSLSFHHTVPLSNGQFAFTFTYAASTLTVVITDSPDVIPNSDIFSAIQSYIYTCPPGG